MRSPDWTPEEDAILTKSATPADAKAALEAAGYTRSHIACNRRRTLIGAHHSPESEDARLTALLLKLAEPYALGSQLKRSASPTSTMTLGITRRLVKRVGKSTYRPTLAGLAWLTERIGDWEGRIWDAQP